MRRLAFSSPFYLQFIYNLYTKGIHLCILIVYKTAIREGKNMSYLPSSNSISINIRVKTHQRDLIDQAADQLGRSRSDFMLESACRRAEEVLLDQAFFIVETKTFEKFQALLDEPIPPSDKLRQLLNQKAPWDQ